MFARTAFRAAQPLRQQTRAYASAAGKGFPWGKILMYSVGGTAGVGLAGVGYMTVTGRTPRTTDVEYKVNTETLEFKRETVPRKYPDMTAATATTDELLDSGTSIEGMTPFLTGGDQGWMSVTLESSEELSHNTKRFRFKLPDPELVSGVFTTSCILTKFQEPGEKPVIRPYTPTSPNNAQGYMELVVKRYEGGPMSTHLHKLQPGMKLDVKGPLPKYFWHTNKHVHVGLVAGGTGITPMWQLVRDIFADKKSKTIVTLVVGNVTEDDILLRKELQALENVFPRRFRVFYTLDKPPKGWNGETGFVTKELLKEVMPEPKLGTDIKIFVCGPPGMMKAISGPKKNPKDQGELSGILKELGYDASQVFKF